MGEWRYSSTHSLISALDGGGWSTRRLDRFTPGKASGTVCIGDWIFCSRFHILSTAFQNKSVQVWTGDQTDSFMRSLHCTNILKYLPLQQHILRGNIWTLKQKFWSSTLSYLLINLNFSSPSGAYMKVTLYWSGSWLYSRRYDRISCNQKEIHKLTFI
jgi:hypothetical protein